MRLLLLTTAAAFAPPQRSLQRLAPLQGGLTIDDGVSLLFVGGKGGVGKTSVSAAIAQKWSREGGRVLIVSTDPAHSLGDAVGKELTATPIRIADNLDAVEVDADGAMAEWRAAVEAFDAESFAGRYGPLGVEAVRALGVDEFVELLANPPSGVDELVALADILKYARDDTYDRVVVDTAPTGHALRLLDLPDFADEFVDRLLSLTDRVGSLASMASKFGLGGAMDSVTSDMDSVAGKLDDLRDKIATVREALADGSRTEFLAVCLPTKLAFAETTRLARDLAQNSRGGGIKLKTVVVNRVVDEATFGEAQVQRLASRQRSLVDRYLNNELRETLPTEAPLATSGQELVGVFGLRFFGGPLFADWADLFEPSKSSKLIVCGGKGGVGKTTVAASLAVAFADQGLRTAIVSTDPAHSLGDALDLQLGTELVEVDTYGASAKLVALEVDADSTARDAASVLASNLGEKLRQSGADSGLADLADAFETPPPGLDELVSLLRVLELLRSKEYDRVVLDTAPTGHTLRLLALPELLDDFAERAIAARDRLKRNPLVGAALSQFSGGVDDSIEDARDRISELQDNAFAMDAILKNADRCEFVMVAAHTELSLRETDDLKRSLDESGVKASRLVINGVLDDEACTNFAASSLQTQGANLALLDELAKELSLSIASAPQFDEDLDGLSGLEALGGALFKSSL